MKRQSRLDCLVFEMLFICELKPNLNKQSDQSTQKYCNILVLDKIINPLNLAPVDYMHMCSLAASSTSLVT